MAVTKLDKAKTAIVIDHPFFASILLKYPIKERRDIPTLAVDKRGQIYYNPDFLESLPVPQIVWGLCHEVMHRVGQHAARLYTRDHKKWNYATDAWINDTLDDAKVGERIDGTVNMPGSKDKTSDQIYDELPDNPGGGGGKGSGQGGGDGLGDDLLDEGAPITEEEARQLESQNRIDVAQAAAAAKMRGKLPGALARYAEEIIDVKTPWYEHLERFMTTKVRCNTTWTRPNRRFAPLGLYMPTVDSVGTMGELVLGIDTSGSIGQEELNEFGAHVNRIMELTRPTKVHVVYCDSRVAHVDEFGPDDWPIKLEGHGGGGTDMREIIEWVKDNDVEPEAIVILTDGYTPFPDNEEYPTLWAMTTDVVAPNGETVDIRVR